MGDNKVRVSVLKEAVDQGGTQRSRQSAFDLENTVSYSLLVNLQMHYVAGTVISTGWL